VCDSLTFTSVCLSPGVHLGDNVVAVSDIQEVVKDADLLVFASPHQYMHNITRKLMGKVGWELQLADLM